MSYRVLKIELNKEKIRIISQFFFDDGKNASQVAEIVNGVYGHNTLTANDMKCLLCYFHSGIFYVKDEPHTGGPIIENIDKFTEMIKVDWHVSSDSRA